MAKIPEEICAVVFDQDGLIDVLEPIVGKRIRRLGVDYSGHHHEKEVYSLELKDGSVLSYTEDQLAKILHDWLGRKIINISLEHRKEFYVRFRI